MSDNHSIMPGWYPNPSDSTSERWWDGTAWSEQTRSLNTPPPPPSWGGNYSTPHTNKPDNYLVWAILTTLLCCLPLGIASIVFAARVDGAWAAGDYAGAVESSEKAKKFAIYAACIGAVVNTLWFAVAIIGSANPPT